MRTPPAFLPSPSSSSSPRCLSLPIAACAGPLPYPCAEREGGDTRGGHKFPEQPVPGNGSGVSQPPPPPPLPPLLANTRLMARPRASSPQLDRARGARGARCPFPAPCFSPFLSPPRGHHPQRGGCFWAAPSPCTQHSGFRHPWRGCAPPCLGFPGGLVSPPRHPPHLGDTRDVATSSQCTISPRSGPKPHLPTPKSQPNRRFLIQDARHLPKSPPNPCFFLGSDAPPQESDGHTAARCGSRGT